MFRIHPWQNGFDLSITGHFLEVHMSEDDETCLYCRCDVTRGQGVNVKKHFGTFSCKQATYKCRIQNQYLQLKQEALKVNTIYRSTHQKFLQAIDHMEFHPKPKTSPEVRLKRSSQKSKGSKFKGYKTYMEDLSDEDVKMLNQMMRLLDTQYLNRTIKVVRKKRFRLASWVMGWGFLQTYKSIKTIKDNIRTLQEQNLLQQDQ